MKAALGALSSCGMTPTGRTLTGFGSAPTRIARMAGVGTLTPAAWRSSEVVPSTSGPSTGPGTGPAQACGTWALTALRLPLMPA